jgi:hypothetical protein
MLAEDRTRKILKYQEEIRNVGNPYSSDEGGKLEASFRLICFKCHAEAVSSKDIRIYVGQHRVVTNPDFRSRCEFDSSTTPSRYTISIIKCMECKLKWGTTFKIDELEIPVLKVTAFLFTVGGEEGRRFKKWGRVDYIIQRIDKSELLEVWKEKSGVQENED